MVTPEESPRFTQEPELERSRLQPASGDLAARASGGSAQVRAGDLEVTDSLRPAPAQGHL